MAAEQPFSCRSAAVFQHRGGSLLSGLRERLLDAPGFFIELALLLFSSAFGLLFLCNDLLHGLTNMGLAATACELHLALAFHVALLLRVRVALVTVMTAHSFLVVNVGFIFFSDGPATGMTLVVLALL